MSDSKYQPPVNQPEKIPGGSVNPESMSVFFLHNSGRWFGVEASKLGLFQQPDNMIGLGFLTDAGDPNILILFPGKLLLDEKKVEVA